MWIKTVATEVESDMKSMAEGVYRSMNHAVLKPQEAQTGLTWFYEALPLTMLHLEFYSNLIL